MILKWVLPAGAATILEGMKDAMFTVSSPVTRFTVAVNGANSVVPSLLLMLNSKPSSISSSPLTTLRKPLGLTVSACSTFTISRVNRPTIFASLVACSNVRIAVRKNFSGPLLPGQTPLRFLLFVERQDHWRCDYHLRRPSLLPGNHRRSCKK